MRLSFLKEELQILKEQNLYRTLKVTESAQDKNMFIANKKYLLFCSNNYLSLANHPKIKQAAIAGIKKYGFGSSASRLISGTSLAHIELEQKIAHFKRHQAALCFTSGYMTNIGLISALTNKKDLIILDKLNHASIIEGAFSSGATIRVYPHKNIVALEKILKSVASFRRKLIITDTIFSMDGDIAPLKEIVHLAKKYNALLMVDEAHATGVFGKNRRGILEHLDLEDKIDITMGTLSKALGCIGGYVTGSAELISFLQNKARSFIYTTSLPPSFCAATMAAIDIIAGKEGEKLQKKLWDNVTLLKKELIALDFDIMNSETQIIPILLKDEQITLHFSQELFKRQLFVPAIRYPTVGKNKSRLRLTVMASHTKKDIYYLLKNLKEIKFKSKNTQ